MQIDDSHCARCKKPNPEAPNSLPIDWEVKNDGVICEGCMTDQDWDAVYEQEREIEADAADGSVD
jgi:hypothetical protein